MVAHDQESFQSDHYEVAEAELEEGSNRGLVPAALR